MSRDVRIVRSDAPERVSLEREGFAVVARSWAAALDAASCDRRKLVEFTARAAPVGMVRAISAGDAAAVLALDTSTLRDYPGHEATAHEPLTADRAAVSDSRRGYAVVASDGVLAAMTFLDVDRDALTAEVDFTVVAPHYRGKGLATAVKAASLLDLLGVGVTAFRTGGSTENRAILASNQALGFVIDEEWVTLKR